MNYKFTDNVPNKDKLFDSVSNELTDNFEDIAEEEIGSTYVPSELNELEIEMTKTKDGNYLVSSGSNIKMLSNEVQEEEQEEKVVIYPATQLYISGMTVVGLFILYRLMMRYK